MKCERCGESSFTYEDGVAIATRKYGSWDFCASLCNGCHNALVLAIVKGDCERELIAVMANERYLADRAACGMVPILMWHEEHAKRRAAAELALFRFMQAFVAAGVPEQKGGSA